MDQVCALASLLVERCGPVVRVRAESDGWRTLTQQLASFDSMMAQAIDPRDSPEIPFLRESIRGWRFYDHIRTDVEAPACSSQIGTRTLVLSDDGYDLAAAIQTIREIGDEDLLAKSINDAFPDSRLSVDCARGEFSLRLQQPGLPRPLGVSEFSEGTLRYILLVQRS